MVFWKENHKHRNTSGLWCIHETPSVETHPGKTWQTSQAVLRWRNRQPASLDSSGRRSWVLAGCAHVSTDPTCQNQQVAALILTSAFWEFHTFYKVFLHASLKWHLVQPNWLLGEKCYHPASHQTAFCDHQHESHHEHENQRLREPMTSCPRLGTTQCSRTECLPKVNKESLGQHLPGQKVEWKEWVLQKIRLRMITHWQLG